MASEAIESAALYKLWAWAETHMKHLLWGFGIVVVLGSVIGFFFWHQNERERSASVALSAILTASLQSGVPAEALVKVAADYAGTAAGGRALLMSGGAYFAAGRYAEAQAQFNKYLTAYRNGPFINQAALGNASCLEAMAKINDAIGAYKAVADRAPDNVAAQAKLALARLYDSQGNLDQARSYYSQIARPDIYFSIGTVAGIRLEELTLARPSTPSTPLTPAAVSTPSNAPGFNLRQN